MSSLDSYLYEESIDSSSMVKEMAYKEMLYCLDQNSGSYNGQIAFDTSILANSGKWLSYSEAYIQIPFHITAQSSLDATTHIPTGFALGLKNGYHQIIDSIQVDYNNTNVIN